MTEIRTVEIVVNQPIRTVQIPGVQFPIRTVEFATPGTQGPQGPQGPQGMPGPEGSFGDIDLGTFN